MVVADDCVTAETPYPFPEMTLRAAGVVPPISVLVLNVIPTPLLFPSRKVPDGSVPIKLPSTKLLVTVTVPEDEVTEIPSPGKRLTTNPRTTQFDDLI